MLRGGQRCAHAPSALAPRVPRAPLVRRLSAFCALATTVLVALSLPAVSVAHAQPDTLTQRLPVIEAVSVRISRDGDRSLLDLPFAITRLNPDSLRPQLRRVGVGDLLFAVPGVQVQSRNNPTQDARIAVRGFGARSAFGVRGVKVLRDGIPLSLPDGQTPMDWLDLETVGTVEAIRGTAAALYGNAAGGVLDFRTVESASVPSELRARFWDGGSARRAQLMGSGTIVPAGRPERTWLASITHTRTNGPRAFAEQEATSGFARLEGTFRNTRLKLLASGFDMPLAQNPGALTAAELAEDVRQADPLSISRNAGKTVRHGQVGVVAEQGSADNGLAAAAWVGARDLDNPLPFAVVTVDRRNMGLWIRGTSSHVWQGFTGRMSAGIDIQSVNDERRNFENCFAQAVSERCPTTSDRGALRVDQREVVQSEGAYVRYELGIPRKLEASVALRWDQIRFDVDDRFVTATNLDDSGEEGQIAVNPMFGLTWRVRPSLSVYTNFSSAFETPTITELTVQGDGSAGLNASLKPQRTRTLETGVRGIVGTRTWLDVAVFEARTDDELIPFEVPGAPGRRAFRNAGRTSRRGLEASVRTLLGRGDAGIAYTASRFRFDEYEVAGTQFGGNAVPGVPVHQANAWITARRGDWFATLDVVSASSVTVNDAATERADGFAAVGVRAGADIQLDRVVLSPMLGIENALDARYASAVLVNATRGRFYEPAPPRTIFAGFRITAR